MLTGILVYVNVAALACGLIALPLFIGAKRQSFLDKNNLLGLILLGIALLLHGGFQTLLRSSPHATFSGYVQGWEGGSNSNDSSLWIYDLGFPPAAPPFYEVPYRNLHLSTSRSNRVPASFWNTDGSEYMKCEYRVWDLEMTRIDASPVPNAGLPGSTTAWQWKSDTGERTWPFLEALLGLLVACRCAWLLGNKEPLRQQLPSPHTVRRFPNKWAARIYMTSVLLILAWIIFVRLSDRFFQHRAQVLLEDIQRLELRKSTWQDVERIRKDYRKHVEGDAGCSPERCDFTVTLNHWSPMQLSKLGEIAWYARDLLGGRWTEIHATVRVRNGVVWGKDFTAVIPHREGYPLIAIAQTTRNSGSGSCDPRNPHPDIRFGSPGGCEICQELWAKVTPYASADEMREAFAFDLSCIGATLRRCTDMSQIMPAAARRREGNSRSNPETRPALVWSPAMIRACGRNADVAAIARVSRIDHEQSSDTHERIDFVDYKVVELLKGTLEKAVFHETLYPKATGEAPLLGEQVIVFGSGGGDGQTFVPLSDNNLEEVRRGIAEDAVDILGVGGSR